jgi:hypothetical protein
MLGEVGSLLRRPGDEGMRSRPLRSRSRIYGILCAISILFVTLIACKLYLASHANTSSHKQIFTGLARSDDLKDETALPCQDFYEHTCGGFGRQELPADKSNWLYSFDGQC